MKLTLHHTLTFSLGTPTRAVEHVLLTPLNTPQQRVERWSIEMPGLADAVTFRDGFGNQAHLVSQIKPEPELVAVAAGSIETFDKAGVLGRLEYDPMPALFRRPTEATRSDPVLIAELPDARGRIAMLHELMGRVHDRLRAPAQTQMQTQGPADPSHEQANASPSPADFAHAFIGGARALDIPTRYVAGYLIEEGTAKPHAWTEAWDEGLGWIGFDPLLNLCPTTGHVRLASGLDALSTLSIRAVPVPVGRITERVEVTVE